MFLRISSRLEKLSPKARVEVVLTVEEEVATEEESLRVKKEKGHLGLVKAVKTLSLAQIRTLATEDKAEAVEILIQLEVAEAEGNVMLEIFLIWVRCQELLAECFS